MTGRRSGHIPNRGELTQDVVLRVLEKFLNRTPDPATRTAPEKGKRPSLCAGCPHRAAYWAIKTTFPGGLFPSDIGCYTLAMNFGAIDTCHCMGACISQAEGFYFAYADEKNPPAIVVSIGDSTFFHAGIPGLINAVLHRARFILVILDNATTAMTGNQPVPHLGITADGSPGRAVLIPDLLKACGVSFIRECDPYDMEALSRHLREADRHCRSEEGGVAAVITKHPCLLDHGAKGNETLWAMTVSEDCSGCRQCLEEFECPALVFNDETGKVDIDDTICASCGVCVAVCPLGAITAREK